MFIVLLLAAFARFVALDRLPPGWRDDELIEVDMDNRIAAGWRPLYIEEAEGHEPLYHYVHAATVALFGSGRASYRWLGAACGLLTVALTMALGRRMFGPAPALWAGAAMAVGFWPLMYSRIGLRHVGVLPPLLFALYALWRAINPGRRFTQINAAENQKVSVRQRLSASQKSRVWFSLAGLGLAAGLYIYFAGRVVPLIAAAFALYLLLFHRPAFRATWQGWLWAGALTLVLFAPLGLYLARRPLEARLEIVGKPLLELRQGNLRPVLETALGTLGMFTFRGDPEWLYNMAGRPVFDWLTGALFYLGVTVALWRWRRMEYGLALTWLVGGLAPALVSLPAASFGHTIVALPAVYLLLGVGLDAIARWLAARGRWGRWAGVFAVTLVLGVNGAWSLRDYVGWSQRDLVRFLYHADVADLARALRGQPEVQDIAIATTTEELCLDARGLALDLPRSGVRPRLFDPSYALVIPAGQPGYVALTTFPRPGPAIESLTRGLPLVAEGPPVAGGPAYRLYRAVRALPEWGGCSPTDFGGGRLTLMDCRVTPQAAHSGQNVEILTVWRVGAASNLSPTLKLFFHLLAPDGQLIAAGDRLDVWPPSLRPGDVFIQTTQIALPTDLAPGDYAVQTGVYDTVTAGRWPAAPPNSAVRLAVVRVGDAP